MLNPLAFVRTYALAGALSLAGLGWAAAGVQTVRLSWLKEANTKAENNALKAVIAKEAEWSLLYKETSDVHAQNLRSIAAERDAAIASLRTRARERLPQTPASCAGASPAALSEQDAGFLIRLAAEADGLRSSYGDCKVKLEALSR